MNEGTKKLHLLTILQLQGKASEIRAYWDILQQHVPLFGYFLESAKAYMVVKEQHNKTVDVFMGSKVKVTSERKRHLVKHSKFYTQNP